MRCVFKLTQHTPNGSVYGHFISYIVKWSVLTRGRTKSIYRQTEIDRLNGLLLADEIIKTKINMGNGTSRQQMTNSLDTYWLNLWLWSTHNLFTDHLRRRRLCFLPQKHEPTIPISIYLAKQLAARHRPFNVRGGVQHNLGPNKLHGVPKNFTREPTKKVSSCRKLKHTFCD